MHIAPTVANVSASRAGHVSSTSLLFFRLGRTWARIAEKRPRRLWAAGRPGTVRSRIVRSPMDKDGPQKTACQAGVADPSQRPLSDNTLLTNNPPFAKSQSKNPTRTCRQAQDATRRALPRRPPAPEHIRCAISNSADIWKTHVELTPTDYIAAHLPDSEPTSVEVALNLAESNQPWPTPRVATPSCRIRAICMSQP